MKNTFTKSALIGCLTVFLFISCSDGSHRENHSMAKSTQVEDEKIFQETMQKHLDAVTNKDIATLKSTMAPHGQMQLILPSTEIINSVDSFIDYHQKWFQDTSVAWTFETEIINTQVGERIGIATTEIIYKEPERDGKPYYNRMNVSYALEKINDKWYIIRDHASSIEKSTDKK